MRTVSTLFTGPENWGPGDRSKSALKDLSGASQPIPAPPTPSTMSGPSTPSPFLKEAGGDLSRHVPEEQGLLAASWLVGAHVHALGQHSDLRG